MALSQSPGSGITGSPGWYVIATTTGLVGLVLHRGTGTFDLGARKNGNVTQAVYVGPVSSDMPTLIGSAGYKITTAFASLGASEKQIVAFIAQADTGAGKQQTNGSGILGDLTLGFAGGGASPHQTTQMLFSPSGAAQAASGTQPVSTTPSGDAQYTGPNVDLSGLYASIEAILEWLTTEKNWVRVLEFVGGAVMIGIAMRELANT